MNYDKPMEVDENGIPTVFFDGKAIVLDKIKITNPTPTKQPTELDADIGEGLFPEEDN